MTRVKVCGITCLEDALAAIEAGADALGFIFAESPRRVTPEQVARITRALPPFIARVGVFVDDPLERIRATARASGLTAIQLHGAEAPSVAHELAEWEVLRAIRVRGEESLAELDAWSCAGFVLDAYVPGIAGGTGVTARWDLARRAVETGRRIVLAGGLTPENVAEALETVRPYALDVGSGVERAPGRKDPAKLAAFFAALRRAEGDAR